jgi:hypothetical protein
MSASSILTIIFPFQCPFRMQFVPKQAHLEDVDRNASMNFVLSCSCGQERVTITSTLSSFAAWFIETVYTFLFG